MRAEFFQHQAERLRCAYSTASMSEERTKVLWERFKGVPDSVFERAVDHLIAEFTTQALPAMSRFSEAVGMFRTSSGGAVMQAVASPHECDPCRDFGYGFNGDTIACCSCERGRRISPEALDKAQKHYNAGAGFLKSHGLAAFRDLPYNPNVRLTGDRE